LQQKVKVIVVTDGDKTAEEALEIAVNDLGLYLLKVSGGNPTPLTGREIVGYILQAPREPVVVMVDDRGKSEIGSGEMVIQELMYHPDEIEILGVVAVASETRVRGIEVDYSINAEGQLVSGPVDKYGFEEEDGHTRLEGDTVEILRKYPDLLVIGCGDPGKMEGQDKAEFGAFITSKCLQSILEKRIKK